MIDVSTNCNIRDTEMASQAKLPSNEITSLSRKFQLSTFIYDLQHGLSFSNALTRLQTMKALMEQVVSEAIENNIDSEEDIFEDASSTIDEGDEPIGIVPVTEPKKIPTYNNVIIPQDKDPMINTGSNNDHDDEHEHNNISCQHHHTETDTSYDHLTVISQAEKTDHQFLRLRIGEINALDINSKQKATMVQKLMMGNYNIEPPSFKDGVRPEQNPSEVQDTYLDALSSVNSDDWRPEYYKPGVYGCPHYQRACKLQCNICHSWHTCRFCHDEKQNENSASYHPLQRNETKWIMCMRCQNVQRPSRNCEKCNEEFALYYCDKCVLYDNDEAKDIYHCDKCGICRLGLGLGIDFFHCDGCQACLSIELLNNHKCIERATMSNCPICGEYMFTSVKPVVYMSPCGHAIHQHCFDEYTKHSYKCPHCQVTVLNMDAQFRVLDKDIEEQPLPEPYCNWICIVSCNDCKGRSKCPYHILGLKCGHCLSYNTVQLKLIKPGNKDDEDVDPAALEQFNHSMNRSLSENLLNDHFQTEDISPLINMDNFVMSNIDHYMNSYFKEKPGKLRESDNVNDFINTNGLFKSQTKARYSNEIMASTSMQRVSSLTEKFKQFISGNATTTSIDSAISLQHTTERSIGEIFQVWRRDAAQFRGQDLSKDDSPTMPKIPDSEGS